MNATQVAHVTSAEPSTPRTPALSVLPPVRLLQKAPTPAIYKPGSKWTVVAAFILSIALHIGAVALLEMNKPPVAVAENSGRNENATFVK
jgi:hypothetical protein